MPIPESTSIELEFEGDPTSLFVFKIDEWLTAAQTQLLVGDLLEERRASESADPLDAVLKRRAEMLPAGISRSSRGSPAPLEAIDVLTCYFSELSGRAGDSKLFRMTFLKFLKGCSCGQSEYLDFIPR